MGAKTMEDGIEPPVVYAWHQPPSFLPTKKNPEATVDVEGQTKLADNASLM